MPKKAKKKGGGGKGGAKTEEERLMLQQQRAQAEEEMARKKEELLTLFLKDKLQKEEKNAAINLLKLNEGWRSILRQTRDGELRQDITVLRQTFERQLDGLDAVIKNLERDLLLQEHQAGQARRVHLQHVDRLRAQHVKHLALMQQHGENALQHLSAMLNTERKQMSSRYQQQRADLEDAMLAVEQQHKTAMAEIHQQFGEAITANEIAHADRKAVLVLDNKNRMEKERVQKQETIQLCSKETTELLQLQDTTQRLVQQLDADTKKAKKLQDSVIRLRTALNSSKTENVAEDQDLTAATNQYKIRTHALRDKLTRSQTAARKQLTKLSVQSDNAAKKLKTVITEGQNVLRVAEMCHKMESKQKNVLTSSLPSEDQKPETTGPEMEDPVQEIPELQKVTRRLNMAVLQRDALRKQRDHLRRENQQLRLLVRQTISEHNLHGQSALLTVYQSPTTVGPPDHQTTTRHTVIEAAHATKHSL